MTNIKGNMKDIVNLVLVDSRKMGMAMMCGWGVGWMGLWGSLLILLLNEQVKEISS